MASNFTPPLQPLPDMQAATLTLAPVDDTLETKPHVDAPRHVHEELPAPDPRPRSLLSKDGFLISCAITPLIGFSFVALGFGSYIAQTHVSSHIQQNTPLESTKDLRLSFSFGILQLLFLLFRW